MTPELHAHVTELPVIFLEVIGKTYGGILVDEWEDRLVIRCAKLVLQIDGKLAFRDTIPGENADLQIMKSQIISSMEPTNFMIKKYFYDQNTLQSVEQACPPELKIGLDFKPDILALALDSMAPSDTSTKSLKEMYPDRGW